MTMRSMLSILGFVAAAALGAACGDVSSQTHGMTPDAGPDAPPPITCSDLTCDVNATCAMTATGAACACKSGFAGDGKTCQDIDECATDNGGCSVGCQNVPGGFQCYAPATCADIKAHAPAAADGNFTLYLDGDPTRPWTAFCADMATAPAEYLSVDTQHNNSQYASGGASPGTTVMTTFSRVRFDPASHEIDIADRTFATSTGMLNHSGSGTMVTSMPYGVAMDCRSASSHGGLGEIDLSGTGFALDAATMFAKGGNQPGGSVQISTDRANVKLSGGGDCGWIAPSGAPANPFNNNVTSGFLLKLVYAS
jgi:hypothetical protein